MSDLSFKIDMIDLLTAGLHQFIAAQAFHVGEGRIEAVACTYSVPLVMVLPEERGFVVLSSRDQIESFFRNKRESLLKAGMPMPRIQVSQVAETGPDRYSVVAEWHFMTHDGFRVGQCRTRQFLERRDGTLSIQMVEFEQVTYPQIAEWFGDEIQRMRSSHAMLH